jgi:hypothetical protein
MILAVFIPSIPFINIFIAPINKFVTCVHELGHAITCLLTGGSVSGLTIVADGAGAGGLTFCHGGIPFIYSQAGYLSTSFIGCALIAIGKYPKLSKALLVFIGIIIACASLFLMPGSIFQEGRILEGLGSIIWGIIIGAGFIYSGLKLKSSTANLLLLFIGTQTALNALNGVFYLVRATTSFESFSSDALIMANMTGIPAFTWASLWAITSIIMFAITLWWTYASSKIFSK